MMLAGVRCTAFITGLRLFGVLILFARGAVRGTVEHRTNVAFLCTGMRICSLNIVYAVWLL